MSAGPLFARSATMISPVIDKIGRNRILSLVVPDDRSPNEAQGASWHDATAHGIIIKCPTPAEPGMLALQSSNVRKGSAVVLAGH